MKIRHLQSTFVNRLQDSYPLEEVKSFFQLAMRHFLNYNPTDIVLNREEVLSEEKTEQLLKACSRLGDHEPIQYILGTTAFYGLPFKVTEDTLIPRPETEELVAWILEHYQAKEEIQLLDIGTGSGCIAVSLAKYLPHAQVTGYDISEDALKIAFKNASVNGVNVVFKTLDILQTQALKPTFDCIVSNPPYVRELEKEEIQPNVLEHEPHTALFVSNADPLVFYRIIGNLAFDNLSTAGSLFFEINQYLGKETIHLLKNIGFTSVQLRKDIFGNDRMIKAQK